MTELLVKIFVKNSANKDDPEVRNCYGTLASITGIICNILLCCAKFITGIVSHSLSITADAVNNLSDAASSIVTLAGFYLSKKPADEEHPFGHARFEYLSGLAVAGLILIIGFQLGKSSIEKIIHPEVVEFSAPLVAVLVISMLVKLWLSAFNSKIGKMISSTSLTATAADARNDVITTGAVLFAAIFAEMTGVNLDGIVGLVVAVFIFVSGIGIGKETIKPLLGAPADEELVKMIQREMLGYDKRILAIHDLMVHDYGPGQRFASVHAEIDSKIDPIEAHDILDNIERMFNEKYHIQMVTHYDPVVTDDEELNSLKELVKQRLSQIDKRLSIHDFRIVRGFDHTNIIFDMVIPNDMEDEKEGVKRCLDDYLSTLDHKYYTVISYDNASFGRFEEED